MATDGCDVLVIGAGNAALCAAITARYAGADVVVLERAPEGERGGNSAFTAGAMRVAYNDVDDLRRLMPDLSDTEIARTDFGSYSETLFFRRYGADHRQRCRPVCGRSLTRTCRSRPASGARQRSGSRLHGDRPG